MPNTQEFIDLDLDLSPHPVSGDIIFLKNIEAVKRSVRNLIFTDLYERPFSPRSGSGLKQLLFEPINPLTQKGIEIAISDVIRVKEPRASIIEIKVEVLADQNGYNASITFNIDNLSTTQTIDLFLERLR